MTPLTLVRPWGFQRLPAWAWLLLQAASLWPHGRWAAARFADGSDDPLGLAALAVLLLALLRLAPRLRETPSAPWLWLSALLTAAATAGLWSLPPLLAAVLAALALGAALAAWLPHGAPRLALAGLALLALPLLASLQFYAGYPLRLLTAQLSTWALQALGLAAERSGAAMTVAGRLVLVDAPCSGVQMVWLGWFCACCGALLVPLRDAALGRRLPVVAALVFTGNVLRNSVLVALEARPQGSSEAAHEAIGLAVLAAVCVAVVAWIGRRDGGATVAERKDDPTTRKERSDGDDMPVQRRAGQATWVRRRAGPASCVERRDGRAAWAAWATWRAGHAERR